MTNINFKKDNIIFELKHSYNCILFENILELNYNNQIIDIHHHYDIFKKYIVDKNDINIENSTNHDIENLFLEFGYYGYTEGINKLRELTKDKIKKEYVNSKSIEDFFEKHTFNKIDKELFSLNPNISESFFRKYPKLIDWKVIGRNPNISEKFLEDNIEFVDMDFVCLNPNVSESFFKKHLHQIDWPEYLLKNPNISEEFIIELVLEYGLEDSIYLWKNSKLSKDFLEKFIPLCNNYFFHYNPNLTIDILQKFEYKLNFSSLVLNEYLNEDIYLFYKDKLTYLDWKELLKHKNVSKTFIEKYCPYNIKLNESNCCRKEPHSFWKVITIDEIKKNKLSLRSPLVDWESFLMNSNISELFFEKIYNLIPEDLLYILCSNDFRYYHQIDYSKHYLFSYL